MASGQLRPLQKIYLQATDAEVEFNQGIADEDSKAIAGAVSGARTGVLIGIVTAILIAIAVSLFVVRSITRPLAIAVGLVDHVSEGDLAESSSLERAVSPVSGLEGYEPFRCPKADVTAADTGDRFATSRSSGPAHARDRLRQDPSAAPARWRCPTPAHCIGSAAFRHVFLRAPLPATSTSRTRPARTIAFVSGGQLRLACA